MQYQNYTKGYQRNTPSISAPIQAPTIEEPPRKQPDSPKVETHVHFVQSRKDGKLWVKHETRIIDWKPVAYYEVAISRKRGEIIAQGMTGN